MKAPRIWVLCGTRAGDTAQALELARQVGGEVTALQLGFTAWHHLPNWIAGASLNSLDVESRGRIVPPWPDLVIATGKRTAPVAAWLRKKTAGRTVAVQLGRPRLAFHLFDLIVTTPQYGLPEAKNVAAVAVPCASPKALDEQALIWWREKWKDLPRPLIASAIGAAKFPLRLGTSQLEEYGAALDALARQERGSVLLFPSPRSRTDAVLQVKSRLAVPSWTSDSGGPGNPYQAALSLADMFAVTGDSVSMISEMLATRKQLFVYPLPRWPVPRWQAKGGLAAALAQSGLLSPPRDVAGFVNELLKARHATDLREAVPIGTAQSFDPGHAEVLRRISSLLQVSSRTRDSSSD